MHVLLPCPVYYINTALSYLAQMQRDVKYARQNEYTNGHTFQWF